MYRHCVTEDTVRRQRQLEQLLLHTMEKKRYRDITVRDLCRDAGISRMAFYQYFDSKDDALTALIDHTLQDLGPTGFSTRDLERLASFWQDHRALLDALHANELDHLFEERSMALVESEDLGFRQHLSPELREFQQLRLRFAVQGITTVIRTWHQGGFAQSVSQIARLLQHILMEPLLVAQ